MKLRPTIFWGSTVILLSAMNLYRIFILHHDTPDLLQTSTTGVSAIILIAIGKHALKAFRTPFLGYANLVFGTGSLLMTGYSLYTLL